MVQFGSVLFAVFALGVAALYLARADPFPMNKQPFPDSQEYASAAYQFAHGNGYVTYVHGPEAQPPRYPPGYSVALAPFARWGPGHPEGVQFGAKMIVLALLVAIWSVSWRLGGPLAAGFAAGFALTSQFMAIMSHLVLSDPLGALLVVLSVGLLASPITTKRVVLAGVVTGASILVRLANIVALVSLLAAMPSSRRRTLALLAALPSVLALLVYQWTTFGSPIKTGYDYYYPGVREFDLSYAWNESLGRDSAYLADERLQGLLMQWACPCPPDGPIAALENAVFYPAVVLGFLWVFTPPLVALLAFVELYRRRKTPEARYAAAVIVGSVLLYTFYFYQGARFMASVGALLMVFSAIGAVTVGLPLVKRVGRLATAIARATCRSRS